MFLNELFRFVPVKISDINLSASAVDKVDINCIDIQQPVNEPVIEVDRMDIIYMDLMLRRKGINIKIAPVNMHYFFMKKLKVIIGQKKKQAKGYEGFIIVAGYR